jgi:hypothetical protein
MTSGVASGAGVCDLAPTPVFTRVPITIPIERVKIRRLRESSFCCLILSKKAMERVTFLYEHYRERVLSIEMDVNQ